LVLVVNKNNGLSECQLNFKSISFCTDNSMFAPTGKIITLQNTYNYKKSTKTLTQSFFYSLLSPFLLWLPCHIYRIKSKNTNLKNNIQSTQT